MSGISFANCPFARLHSLMNPLSASFASLLPLPASLQLSLYYFFASLQAPSNHGARCLPQRLGLSGGCILDSLITPARSPASKKYFSIFADFSSFVSPKSPIIASIPCWNSSVLVCFFHFSIPYTWSWMVDPTSQR